MQHAENSREGLPTVSLITVCYNSEATLRGTLESVLAQTYAPTEYWIIDGASQDGTVAIAQEYQQAFAEKGIAYHIVSEKDRGIYDAMNKGIRLANGRLVGIINSDDWYEPEAVETAARAWAETGYDMFYADIRLIRRDGSTMIKRSRMDRFPSSRHWNHPTTFITKATYEEVGLYRCQSLYDDFDLVLRIRRAGKRIVIRNQVLANFRVGGASNEKSLAKALRRCRMRYQCYRNNGYSAFYWFECFAMEMAKLILS